MSTRIQILIDQENKIKAEAAFARFGLNLSEGVRLLLSSFVNGKARVDFSNDDEAVFLSDQVKLRYENIDQDIKTNKNLVKISSEKSLSNQI